MVPKSTLIAIRDKAFSQQLDFIKDKSKRKALFVGRRAGKSTAIGIYFLLGALTNPGAALSYFGLTAGSAEDVMYPILLGVEGLITQFLAPSQYKYNHTEKIIQFNNQSTISFGGIDVNYKEVDKVLGTKKYMICIDECQNQTQDLKDIIER